MTEEEQLSYLAITSKKDTLMRLLSSDAINEARIAEMNELLIELYSVNDLDTRPLRIESALGNAIVSPTVNSSKYLGLDFMVGLTPPIIEV